MKGKKMRTWILMMTTMNDGLCLRSCVCGRPRKCHTEASAWIDQL